MFSGTVGYTSQNPWIYNATVKENILFGEEFDSARFESALHACALAADLDTASHPLVYDNYCMHDLCFVLLQLPAREDTEIGERGINLSGGQKARVALARVVYSHSDIVLLDDPLSAVGKLLLVGWL